MVAGIAFSGPTVGWTRTSSLISRVTALASRGPSHQWPTSSAALRLRTSMSCISQGRCTAGRAAAGPQPTSRQLSNLRGPQAAHSHRPLTITLRNLPTITRNQSRHFSGLIPVAVIQCNQPATLNLCNHLSSSLNSLQSALNSTLEICWIKGAAVIRNLVAATSNRHLSSRRLEITGTNILEWVRCRNPPQGVPSNLLLVIFSQSQHLNPPTPQREAR